MKNGCEKGKVVGLKDLKIENGEYLDVTVRELLEWMSRTRIGKLAFTGKPGKGEPFCIAFAHGLQEAKTLGRKVFMCPVDFQSSSEIQESKWLDAHDKGSQKTCMKKVREE